MYGRRGRRIGYRRRFRKSTRTTRRPFRARRYIRRTRVGRRLPIEMPASVMVKLRSFTAFTLSTAGATAGAYNAISLNSAYDPYVGAGGGSCTGFTQWAALYGRYMVRASKHVVRAQVNTNGSVDGVFGMYPLASTDTVPSLFKQADALTEIKGARMRVMGNASSAASTDPRIVLTKYFSIRRIEGQSSLDDDLYGAAVTADPTRQPQLIIAMGSYSNFTAEVHVVVQSTYYVKFYRPLCAALAE